MGSLRTTKSVGVLSRARRALPGADGRSRDPADAPADGGASIASTKYHTLSPSMDTRDLDDLPTRLASRSRSRDYGRSASKEDDLANLWWLDEPRELRQLSIDRLEPTTPPGASADYLLALQSLDDGYFEGRGAGDGAAASPRPPPEAASPKTRDRRKSDDIYDEMLARAAPSPRGARRDGPPRADPRGPAVGRGDGRGGRAARRRPRSRGGGGRGRGGTAAAASKKKRDRAPGAAARAAAHRAAADAEPHRGRPALLGRPRGVGGGPARAPPAAAATDDEARGAAELKTEAVSLRREGRVDDALARMRKAKTVEHALASRPWQDGGAPRIPPRARPLVCAMGSADESTALVGARPAPRWRFAALGAGLGCLALAAVAVGQPAAPRSAPAALAAFEDLDFEQQFDVVYDILVTQDYSAHVICTGDAEATPTYALCGEASCSPYGDAALRGSVRVQGGDGRTFRSAVVASFGGTLGDDDVAAFCAALGDGTVCRESGLGCDLVSFHSSGYRRRLDVEPAGVTSELLSTTCMGAPCYYADDEATGDCALTCLCPMGVEYSFDERRALAVSDCMTHRDDYTVVASVGAARGLIGDLAAAYGGVAPTVVGSCATCDVNDDN
ncbi:hypothetical protein JL722_11490 [Aureococcus anophagefferens]|nr:hypothetical protein JL722_11490 [Aureococcus anophagefferens]